MLQHSRAGPDGLGMGELTLRAYKQHWPLLLLIAVHCCKKWLVWAMPKRSPWWSRHGELAGWQVLQLMRPRTRVMSWPCGVLKPNLVISLPDESWLCLFFFSFPFNYLFYQSCRISRKQGNNRISKSIPSKIPQSDSIEKNPKNRGHKTDQRLLAMSTCK